jgi:hypothetical protein
MYRLDTGDRGQLRDAFYLIDKDHTPAARLCLAAALAGGGPHALYPVEGQRRQNPRIRGFE